MNVVFHEDFFNVYAADPAAAAGRLEPVVDIIEPHVTFVQAEPAAQADIEAVHTARHVQRVRQTGLYPAACLAAGGAIQTAVLGLDQPAFGLLRPPGHHASADSAWGFCHFNNMAIAIQHLRRRQRIESALVLDIDLHYGDGNVNTLGKVPGVRIFNPEAHERRPYLEQVAAELAHHPVDVIGVSAGFDNHVDDWGGLLLTEDYFEIGRLVRGASQKNGGGGFAILEGGYNHDVLGVNVLALIEGLNLPG
jgi:acetoin utilization deacetylase AcuC-like enzyme